LPQTRPVLRATAGVRVDPLTLLGALGDHVDHAVHGIGAPQRRARPADHLDAVEVFQDQILDVPVDPTEELVVDDAPVDQDLQLVGEQAVEAPCADAPLAAVHAAHVHARHHAQHLGEAAQAAAAHLVAADHVDRSRGLEPAAGRAGHGRHRKLDELFQRQVEEVSGRGRGGLGRDRGGPEPSTFGAVTGHR
jgi:hypothetical protein